MNIISKATLTALTLALVTMVAYSGATDRSMIKSVQSGEATLTCHLGVDQHVVIDPGMVVGYDDIRGWIFTNGSAKSCELTY